MDEIDFNVRAALTTDRSRLANLIHFSPYIHQHLDWKSPLDWIGSKPYLLIAKGGDILSALACPPDLPGITWIRLFAVNSNINLRYAWDMLWRATRIELSQIGRISVAAISLQGWFNELLRESKFEHTDDVVVLMWNRDTSIPDPSLKNIQVRPMLLEDMRIVEKIDHDAFVTIWQNSIEALELAFQQSSLATVAELDEEIIGYQFSTSSPMGSHLARLAVKTTMQGKGVGYLLVHQVLKQFERQGVKNVTVNTQKSNTVSLALYLKAGFNLTGESYQVLQHNVDR